MRLPGIKLVTFDVTNTLLKFHKPPWEHYAAVAHKFGFKGNGISIKNKLLDNYKHMTKQHPNFGKDTISWERWWGKVIEMTFQGDISLANIDMISKKLIEDYKTAICWQISEGSEDLIKILKQSNITIGVISNFDPRLHEILFNLNLNKYFEFIITSYEVGISKPDKKIFQIAQEKCNKDIDSTQCLHIGDDITNDYIGATEAGWNALLITKSIKHIESQVLDKTFLNLKELCKKLENNELCLR
ncbi:rhythmically expressed gene 2 protein [Vanessa atalanta]|uniref:rhythmically expressed gene 2 protein n=1 Tax=Vanessa atalanta TaxID=42275 RepID=UPI001FCDE9FB|nr:rhythmically expressed gene 2 protein [Vanessa atalanta]